MTLRKRILAVTAAALFALGVWGGVAAYAHSQQWCYVYGPVSLYPSYRPTPDHVHDKQVRPGYFRHCLAHKPED